MVKFKRVIAGIGLALLLLTCTPIKALAYYGGNRSSGASCYEYGDLIYSGAAWNYSESIYKSTSFKFTRNKELLMSKTAYKTRVTGFVIDDLRVGKKYTTVFSWSRGPRK